jgi:hypothetical protein
VLGVVALGGIALAVHGWAGRHALIAPGSLAGGASHAAQSTATPPANGSGHTAPSGSGPTAPSSARPTASGSGGQATHSTPGPLLSSQAYAQYSFLVWPGTPSSVARAAMTGLTISVHRTGPGITVTAGVTGQQAPSPAYYSTGAKVYVIEASLGDDSNNLDYNLGDDGLVVTNSAGRILR